MDHAQLGAGRARQEGLLRAIGDKAVALVEADGVFVAGQHHSATYG